MLILRQLQRKSGVRAVHKIIQSVKAEELRAGFIKAFVDTSTEYYKKYIEGTKPTDTVTDSVYGYMRDTLLWD